MALDKPKKFILYFKLGDFDESINISEGVLWQASAKSTISLNIYPGQLLSECFVPNFRFILLFAVSISK